MCAFSCLANPQVRASGSDGRRLHRDHLSRRRQRVADDPLGAGVLAQLVLVLSAAVFHHAHRFRELRLPGAAAGGGVQPQGQAPHVLAHTGEQGERERYNRGPSCFVYIIATGLCFFGGYM